MYGDQFPIPHLDCESKNSSWNDQGSAIGQDAANSSQRKTGFGHDDAVNEEDYTFFLQYLMDAIPDIP